MLFLRIVRSLDLNVRLIEQRCVRFFSESSTNFAEIRPSIVPRPIKVPNSKQTSMSADAPSSMKLPVLKRIPRKKPAWKHTDGSNQREEEYFNVTAYATADWYDLDQLKQRFLSLASSHKLIDTSNIIDNILCIEMQAPTKAKSQAFIFDDGAVVFWNVKQEDEKLILNEIDVVSDNQYPKNFVDSEKEMMNFVEISSMSTLTKDIIKLSRQSDSEQLLDKYTFSNALALSVKLGIWEALLDQEAEFVADLANRLKQGKHIKIAHGLMQRKSGELYSLKHAVNLSHDFLDTPDFYWSNSRLENLYIKVFNYFTIAKRTKVLNERLNFSLELISVIEASLNEKKHVRLEWIIILLIFVEVFFNIIDHTDFSTWKSFSTSPDSRV